MRRVKYAAANTAACVKEVINTVLFLLGRLNKRPGVSKIKRITGTIIFAGFAIAAEKFIYSSKYKQVLFYLRLLVFLDFLDFFDFLDFLDFLVFFTPPLVGVIFSDQISL